jgi:hypothetical protein
LAIIAKHERRIDRNKSEQIARNRGGLLAVSGRLGRMPETSDAVEDRRCARRWQNEVRSEQRQNPDGSGGEIGDAEFAHQGEGLVAVDFEYLLGGEPRLEVLPQARECEANADRPEDDPFADKRHQRRAAGKEGMLDHDRDGRRRNHEARDNGEIHSVLPVPAATAAPPRMTAHIH